MLRLLRIFVAIIFLICTPHLLQAQSNTGNGPNPSKNLKYKVFQSGTGWGYDITDNDKVLIHQPRIPGMSGIHPFISSAEAGKVAGLAILKIKKGVFPPTITYSELDSLKITR